MTFRNGLVRHAAQFSVRGPIMLGDFALGNAIMMVKKVRKGLIGEAAGI